MNGLERGAGERGGGFGKDESGADRLRGLEGGPIIEGAGSAFSAPGTAGLRRGDAAGVTLARILGAAEGREFESREEVGGEGFR